MMNSNYWGGSSSDNQGWGNKRTAAPNAISPASSRDSRGMTPFNPYMSQQDYFSGIAPWKSGQLSQQNPMMSMGNQPGGWGNKLQVQNPMMTMGMQNIPSLRATSNPFMPSFQQIAPQQQPQNPYSPYRNDWGWAQQSPFAGLRYPAY